MTQNPDVLSGWALEKAEREECPQGHRLSAPNLAANQLRVGRRECLKCLRERNRRRMERQRVLARFMLAHYDVISQAVEGLSP